MEKSLSVWHEGERALQGYAGVAERMAEIGQRVIHPQLTEQHREFLPLLSFVVIAAVDHEGWPWATMRAGVPGFLSAPSPTRLSIRIPQDDTDPVEAVLARGAAAGLLGIDLTTRRRNRVNGRVVLTSGDELVLAVEQAFGNCPMYIHRRKSVFVRDPRLPSAAPPRRLPRLDVRCRELIASSDSFFVGSYAPREDGAAQVDASHRGGHPGFAHVSDDDLITVPDYSGNHYFATLGNMLLTRRAGVVFVDFKAGDLLHITGQVELLLEAADLMNMPGAERAWRMQPHQIIYRPQALPIVWSDLPGEARANA